MGFFPILRPRWKGMKHQSGGGLKRVVTYGFVPKIAKIFLGKIDQLEPFPPQKKQVQ